MTDNQIIERLITRLRTVLDANGMADVSISQKTQPEFQGVPSGRSVFIQKLFDNRFGFVGRTQTYDEPSDTITKTDQQVIDVTFQISVLARQGYDPTKPTASDIANLLAMALSSRGTIHAFMPEANILRITDVRNMDFEDDQSRFEYIPSFDVTFVTDRTFNEIIQVIDRVTGVELEV